MSDLLQVGAEVDVFRGYGWQSRNEVLAALHRSRIVRETPTLWVLASGDRFDKKTLSLKPRYLDYDTFIRAVTP